MPGKFFVVLLVFVVSCSKKQEFKDVKVLGHGANGLEIINSVYHDNSKEAVDFALSIEGCDGVEIDIQVSQDGNLWLYHDDFLETETDGSGCINEKTTAQLQSIHYTTFAKEKLVSIEELNFQQFKGKEILLDLRHYNLCAESFVSVNAIISKLNELNLKNPTDFEVKCIISNSLWLQPFIDEGYKVIYSIYSQNEFLQTELLYPSIDGYCVKNADFTKDQVKAIKDSAKKVYIFEMRSPKGIRKALKKFPDAVITDDIRTTLIEKY